MLKEFQLQRSHLAGSVAGAMGVVLALALLSLGFFDFGHDHWHDPAADEHQCVACHLQVNALATGSVAVISLPEPISELRAVQPLLFYPADTSPTPPLRGPPAVTSARPEAATSARPEAATSARPEAAT